MLEAAFPKFVNQVGDNTKYRDWVSDDKIVDTDGSSLTFNGF